MPKRWVNSDDVVSSEVESADGGVGEDDGLCVVTN